MVHFHAEALPQRLDDRSGWLAPSTRQPTNSRDGCATDRNMSGYQAPDPTSDSVLDMTPVSRWPRASWLLGVLSFGWIVLWFAGLNLRPLGEPDEARYAEVAREMLASGEWLTPKLDGFNFFDKPALQYWASALFYELFGAHEWTARLWVALTGLLAIVAVGWASKRLYGVRTGWIAALVLGSSLLFVAGAHINTMDMGVAAFLTVAICLFLVAQFDPSAEQQRVRLNLVGWASLALAVLSKGLIGLVLPAITLTVFMLWERDWTILRRITMGWGLCVVLLIAAPWFIAISFKHSDFFDYFFIKEHFSRFLTNVYDRDRPWWFFIPVVLLGSFPWVAFLPFSRCGWRGASERGSGRFLLCWIAVVFAFFSASHSKLPFYILPIFPAFAMLIARRLSTLTVRALEWRFMWISALAVTMAVVALTLTLSTRHLSQHTDMHPAQMWLMRGLSTLAIVSAICAFMLARGCHAATVASLLGFVTLFVWQMLFANVGVLASNLSAEPVAKIMLPNIQSDTEIFTVHAYLRGLSFYLQRLVTVVDEDPDDVLAGTLARPKGFVPSIDIFEARWRAAPDAIAVIDPSLLSRLSEDRLPMRVLGTAPSGIVIGRIVSKDLATP
jgi:4-amino-4-deoxy-L-arabinose transferase-like glycosyltransferase